MNFCIDIPDPQIMQPNNFGDPQPLNFKKH